MDACDACVRDTGLAPIPRWKAPLLLVGFLLFCPCHLPVTFAAFAALAGGLTGALWLFGNKLLIYALFSLVYLVIVVALFRWLVQHRARERLLEHAHASHVPQD